MWMSIRDILEKNTRMTLYIEENGIRVARDFIIMGLISDKGASTLAYRAYHENSSNIGILREFYPLEEELVLKRKDDGSLIVEQDEELECERHHFYQKRKEYLAPYLLLRELQIRNDNDALASFIPYFEICYGDRRKDSDQGTIYIWTPSPKAETFEAICREIHENPKIRSEYKLYLVLKAALSLTQCVTELHNVGLIHRDIKPDNFGFLRRGDNILTENVSMFDIDSICPAYPLPEYDVGSWGFMEAKDQRKTDNLRDIYSIGATLFYAIIVTDKTKKNGYRYCDDFFDEIPDLIRRSELISSSEINSYPRLIECLTRILRKCLCSRRSCDYKRYGGCESLAEDLKKAICYLLPTVMSRDLARGERWVVADSEFWFYQMEKRNSTLALQMFLYRFPLYRQLESSKELNILLVGFGRYSYLFMDLVLEAAQNLKAKFSVTILSYSAPEGERSDKDLYLEARPELKSFFELSAEKKMQDSYGNIIFKEGIFQAQDSRDDIQSKILKEVALKKGSYIFVDLENDDFNQKISETIYGEAEDSFIGYIQEQKKQVPFDNKERVRPIYISEDPSKTEVFFEVERMAFNTHLIWNDNPEISMDEKKAEFLSEYNFKSCISNAFSIQYKLWDLGIDLGEVNHYEAAGRFAEKIKEKATRQALAWREHKRWVTEKICAGWRKRELDESFTIQKDSVKKTHLCLVKSYPDSGLAGLSIRDWDNVEGYDLSALDELDRTSIELHRQYVRYCKQVPLKDFAEMDLILKDSPIYVSFKEWQEKMEHLIRFGKRGDQRLCEAMWLDIKEKMKKSNLPEIKRNVERLISMVEFWTKPYLERYRYKDFKKIDFHLIDRIPFILTYREDISLLIPMRGYSSLPNHIRPGIRAKEAFSCVASAGMIRPKQIHYLYPIFLESRDSEEEEFQYLKAMFPSVAGYLYQKKLCSVVRFVLYGKDPEIGQSMVAKLRTVMDNVGFLQTEIVFQRTKCGNIVLFVPEYVEENNLPQEKILVERNAQLPSSLYIGSTLEQMYSSFRFEGVTSRFYECENCSWLKYLYIKPFIRVRELMDLSGISYRVRERSALSYLNVSELWKIYINDRKAWKIACSFFRMTKTGYIELLNLCGLEVASQAKEIYRKFYVEMEVAETLKEILKVINQGKMASLGMIYPCTDKIACMEVIATKEMIEQLEKLLSFPHYLRDKNNIIISVSEENELIVGYQGLAVKEKGITETLTENMSSFENVLKTLQSGGYLHNLSLDEKELSFTYGAKEIRDILCSEENVAEHRIYFEIKQSDYFDDVVGEIFILDDEGKRVDKFDCVVTKGYQSVFVECMTVDNVHFPWKEEVLKKFQNRISQYGVNAKGIMIIDTESDLEMNNVLESGKEIEGQIKIVRLQELDNSQGENSLSITELIKKMIEENSEEIKEKENE